MSIAELSRTFIILLLICKLHLALSDSCTKLRETSGTISNEMYQFEDSKCWKIIVPSDSYVHLKMNSLLTTFNPDCTMSAVEVSIANKKEKYTFCPEQDDDWQSIMAFNDITVTQKMIIESTYDYDDDYTSSFSMTYRQENFLCSQKGFFKCSNDTCIPQSQVCDGTKHCSNGEDEKGCQSGISAIPGVDSSRLKSIKWLKERWSPTFGWQENTHRGIIALNLATERNTSGIDLEFNLMVKQLEVQTLAAILKNESEPLTVNQLSMFVNALIGSCQDPYNFYGYDLVKLLKEKIENSLNAHPLSYLTLCIAGETLSVNATRDLIELLNSDSEYAFLLEFQAAAVVAFSCAPYNENSETNSSVVNNVYKKAVTKFKQLQLDDGSFGNVYTTAIVTQALLSAGEENSKDWKLKRAVNYLMEKLNSSSVDFLAVYLILPVLNGKSLVDIAILNCWDGQPPKLQGGSVHDTKNKIGFKMRAQYFLYIGEQKDIVYSLSLRVPENITVFNIMQLAEEADQKYKFQWKQMGEKVYIYEIAAITNDFEDGLFWLLYVGKDGDSMVHIKESPDKVTVDDGAQIIMWYRMAQI